MCISVISEDPRLQLQQTPGPQNPVFLPSDPGCDWLLAKIWVHSADFQCHQLSSHYLRTHMLGELCCVATLRQLPELHPLHQVHKLTPPSLCDGSLYLHRCTPTLDLGSVH